MPELIKAKEPFRFYTRLNLSELTGLKASTLLELVELITTVSGSSIYHHTHRYIQQHQYLSPEPPNDFAYWVREFLSEKELAERLASIDTVQFSTIRDLREKIVVTIEDYLKKYPSSQKKFVRENQEFHFIKSVSFVLPTKYAAYDLREFVEVLRKITIDSIYYHIFEARLRLEKSSNDFSHWIGDSLGEQGVAREIARCDPYTYTLEDLRKMMIRIIERRL
jgi:hypothetical protein